MYAEEGLAVHTSVGLEMEGRVWRGVLANRSTKLLAACPSTPDTLKRVMEEAHVHTDAGLFFNQL